MFQGKKNKCVLTALMAGAAFFGFMPDKAQAQITTTNSVSSAALASSTPSVSSSSSTAVCPVAVTPPDDSDQADAGDGDGGGGSGGACLVPDTMVAMKDGSLKPIQLLRAGDETIAGKVLDFYANTSEERDLLSKKDANYSAAKALYTYKGVVGTGHHVVLEGDAWLDIAACEGSEMISNPDMVAVYNLRMENAIIPVINETGELLLFTDTFNNGAGESEMGLKRIGQFGNNSDLLSKVA